MPRNRIAIRNALLEFESRDLVQRLYRKRHNRKLSDKKAKEITSCFIQAREYSENANKSNITVKPLLQYYGILALSRGLILSCVNSKSEASLKSSHGLEIHNWRQSLNDSDFGALEVKIKKGTFYELLKATSNESYIMAKTTAINWHWQYDLPAIESIISFKQLIKNIPDLAIPYNLWTDDTLSMGVLESLKHSKIDKTYKITFQRQIGEVIINCLFPDLFCENKLITEEQNKSVITLSDSFMPSVTQHYQGAFGIGDGCIVEPYPNETRINMLGSFYAASYFLGMLARYYPSVWISLGRAEKGDSIYPLIHQLIDFLSEKYPEAVLNYLKGPYTFEQ